MTNEIELLAAEYKKIIDFCKYAQLTEYEEKLNRKLDDLLSPLKIMIVGEGKSGKSTLLNALVGCDIAQVDDEPKTWCINLYSGTDGLPYAELVYPDETQIVSIEDANEISERISHCESYESLSEKDRSLQEIRWYTKLEWPEKEIYIIDTPGFNQVRKDTSVETISIDGVEGVKFSAKESFEKYYYKADLVLWCFEATSVGDREVEEHLKSVYKQGKRIYGIITKLDREEDPDQRERLFLENDKRYKKYNLVTSIRSGLPMIYDDDDEEEAEEKKRIRIESVESIRRCIDYLLNDNKEAEEIKLENSRRYLSEVKGKIEAVEAKMLSFFYDNFLIGKKSIERMNEELSKSCSVYENKFKEKIDYARVEMRSPQMLNGLWTESGEDTGVFANNLSKMFENSAVLKDCERELHSFEEEQNGIISHNLMSLRLKNITLSMDEPQEDSSFLDSFSTQTEQFYFDYLQTGFSISEEHMGLVYQIMQMFEKSSTVYQVINLLAGDMIRDRMISAASDAISEKLDEIQNQFSDIFWWVKFSAEREGNSAMEKKIRNHTGYDSGHLPDKILSLEEKLAENDLYHNPGMEYYPKVVNGKLLFCPSLYKKLLNREPDQAPQDAPDLYADQYFRPVFKKRIDELLDKMRTALKRYDGSFAIQKPEPVLFEFQDDGEAKEQLPFFSMINWIGMFEKVKDRYYEAQREYLSEADSYWKAGSEASENLVIKEKSAQISRDLDPEFTRFKDAYHAQLMSDINGYLSMQMWYNLPASADYYDYYLQIYSKYYPQDMLIGYIKKNESKRSVPKVYRDKYHVIAVNGKKRSKDINDIVFENLIKYSHMLSEERENCLKTWDYYFSEYEKMVCNVCDKYLIALDNFLRQKSVQGWEDYKLTAGTAGKNNCKTILEYTIKAGKLPDEYKKILTGNIPELIYYSNIIRADGTHFSDYWKGYIKTELKKLMEEY